MVVLRSIIFAQFRKLLLWSLVGVTAAMLFLGGAFRLAEMNSPPVALDNECPAFEGNTCTDCIRQVPCHPTSPLALLSQGSTQLHPVDDIHKLLTPCSGQSHDHEPQRF